MRRVRKEDLKSEDKIKIIYTRNSLIMENDEIIAEFVEKREDRYIIRVIKIISQDIDVNGDPYYKIGELGIIYSGDVIYLMSRNEYLLEML